MSLAVLTIPLARLTISLEDDVSTRIASIGQISIRVHDVERAVTFYRDALGLEFLFDAGPLAFLMCGDVRLMLTTPERDEFDHPSSTLYFRVDDIHAAREGAERRRAPEHEDRESGQPCRGQAALVVHAPNPPEQVDRRGVEAIRDVDVSEGR